MALGFGIIENARMPPRQPRRYVLLPKKSAARSRVKPAAEAITRSVALQSDTEISHDCGRDTHYWAPPAQNRTGSFPAYGSHLGCLTAGLGLPYALRRR